MNRHISIPISPFRICNPWIMAAIIPLMIAASSCRKHKAVEKEMAIPEEIVELDTATPIVTAQDTVKTEEEPEFKVEDYPESILPAIEEASPEYAAKLAEEGDRGFIVVDKARMKVILYDRYGMEEKAYGMACAKNYGNKHKRADSRTPEGYFNVQGVYDSTEWLFTDDEGKTSKKKGQFGPRFIRLNYPQIGIHGTCAPWSVGHRTSHGCIRITNENIMELVDLVHTGMPVIIIPGKRDRKVNREEGHDGVYFPTTAATAMSEAEKKEAAKTLEEIEAEKIRKEIEDQHRHDSIKAREDSLRLQSIKPDSGDDETTQGEGQDEEEKSKIYF